MNFLRYISFFTFIIQLNIGISYKNPFIIKNNRILRDSISNNQIIINNPTPIIKKQKFNSFLQLIRSKSILPTFLLCFSGGFIMNPAISELLKSTQFIVSIINIILITSSSMIINDIFDIEIDKINSPNRPLVTGVISRKEAILYSTILLGVCEILNIRFLPQNLRRIVHLSILFILFYTPFLKKILFVKNISCATIVGFSLIFSGLSSSNIPIFNNPNRDILLSACSIIFSGSLVNEIILDIRDIEGDSSQGIRTIPIIYGKDTSLLIVYLIWYYTILSNFIYLTYSRNIIISGILLRILYPQLIYVNEIYRNIYLEYPIKRYFNRSNKTMIILLLYFCVLSINQLFDFSLFLGLK
jgi:geranylgeranylglycerol-phosphate geranylgeranyltransferase